MTVDGMIAVESVGCFAATVQRLDATMHERGISPMLRMDHAAAAGSVGLELRPLLLLLFGDPRVGTALMRENPTAGIDLPLKLLVWEDDGGRTWIGYNDPVWIRARHGIGQAQEASGKMASLLGGLARAAVGEAPR